MKILIPREIYDDFVPAARDAAPDVTFLPYGNDEPSPEGVAQADAIFWWYTVRCLDQILANGPRIRWVQTGSAGVDNVLSPAVRAHAGLTLTDSGPAFENSIPEFVMGWILSVSHRLYDLRDQQREHKWNWLEHRDVWGQTVGIIGLGPIGRGVAARAKAFGMRTLGFRRSQAPAPNVDEVLTGDDGLLRLLAESDFVVLAASLTAESRGLIGARQLSAMKSTAWLMNIARGALVDEAALIDALRSGRIGGACLDVFTTEPLPSDSPLWDLPNVRISPHNSPGRGTVRAGQERIFVENLKRFVNGEPLENVVDFARGY